MFTTPILTEHVVIDATDRFAGDPGLLRRKIAIDWNNLPENTINAMSRLQKPWSEAKIRRAYGPSIKMLPFVAMKEDAKSWCDNALNYWCDEPAQKGHVDFRRGVLYAELTLKATKKEGVCLIIPKKISRRSLMMRLSAVERVAREAGPTEHQQSMASFI